MGARKMTANTSADNKRGTNFRAKTRPLNTGKNIERDGGGFGMLKKRTNSNTKFKKDFEVGGGGNGTPNMGSKSRTSFKNQFDVNQNKSGTGFPGNFGRNKFQGKKSSIDYSARTDEKPKKKKRVIRLDPYDFSNKRMDDGRATTDSCMEKKEEPKEDKDVEISKNAQFRAIQPSPSILSFVEENLLGRRREIELRRAGYDTEIAVPLDNIPSSTSSERARIEETKNVIPHRDRTWSAGTALESIRQGAFSSYNSSSSFAYKVFRNKLTFFAAAKISSSLPPPEVPEIAFAGRSNVGKSSILNALTRQWGVVWTSDKPGLTQTINFFNLGPKLNLVDLPGYGFAYAKEEVKEAWEELVKEYVSTRVGLKQVCLLIDTKWGMKPRDHELIDLMERSQTKYQVVLTKTDLVFPIDVARRAMQIEEKLKANKSVVQPVMMVSSKSGAGIRCLRTALAKIARFAKL